MTVMGLLQNTWARNPMGIEEMMRRNPDRRNKLIARLLFGSRCATGRRLRKIFGSLCDTIVWENATPIVTIRPGTQVSGDAGHVRAALERINPDVVLAFGGVAYKTIETIGWGVINKSASRRVSVIRGPHPAARYNNILERLHLMRWHLEKTKDGERHGEEKES